MINRTFRFFLPNLIAVLFIISCASNDSQTASLAAASSQRPGQDLLDELNAAMARAQSGRENAMAVQAQAYFPDEWNKAEADNNAGKDANKGTADGVMQGIALFTSAAEGYEAIAGNAAPLFAKDMEDANSALQAAIAKAEKSRKDAQDSQAPDYFPDDWAGAEAERQSGIDAKKDTIEEMKADAAIFISAADSYDAIAEKSKQILAKEKDDADKALQAAMAQAEKSRQAAMDVSGQTYFPNDWRDAEAKNTSGKNAKKTTAEEIKAATALFVSAAAAYDDIAARSRDRFAKDKDDADKALQAAMARADKSRQAAVAADAQTNLPNDWRSAETKNTSAKNAKATTVDEIKAATALFVSAADAYDDLARRSQQQAAKDKDDASKALQAAIARADKSRQAAVAADAQTYLPNDWRSAETKNTSAKNAKATTVNEMKAATALFVSAADAYDDLAKKSQQQAAKDKDDADKALQAAIARMDKSRKDAQDAKANVNLPTDWNNAEAKNKTAAGAKRGTTAEIKAATPLYTSAADAYDDLVRKNVAFMNTQNQKSAEDAKARAEQERKKALDVKADIAVAAEFGGADAVFKQAAAEFDNKGFSSAIESYNKSADLFIAAALSAEKKRVLADDTIGEAKQRSAQSADFAVNTGVAMEGENEPI